MLDDAAPEAGADWVLDSGDATVQGQSFCNEGDDLSRIAIATALPVRAVCAGCRPYLEAWQRL
jgi:hypothetical protein